jgi:hypothetical protein
MTGVTAAPLPERPRAARARAGETLLRVSLRPTTELIAAVREFAQELTAEVLGDREIGSRVALAVHELLENAVKYSTDGEAVVSVAIAERDGRPLASVTVTNRIGAERVAALREALDELSAAADPQAFYRDVMLRGALRASGSGLGLARIRAEADMSVRGEIQGDAVSVVAEGYGGDT